MRLIAGIVSAVAVGTVLFFSCGKADEKKDSGASPTDDGDVEVHLTFEAYEDGAADSFRVYAGTSKDSLKLAHEFEPANGFDYSAPEITFDSKDNPVMAKLLGGQGCFQLRAVKGGVESDGSNTVCTDL